MKLTRPNQRLIEQNETLVQLENRMIVREGKSQETLRRYLDGVKHFTEYMEASSPDLALRLLAESADRTDTLDGFIDWLIAQRKKPINIKALWQGVKKWLVSNRINEIDWSYISRPKATSQIRDRIPTTEELQRILDNKVSLRDKAFFLTATSSGLRMGTLATLQVKDYKPVEELGMITVEGAEGRKLAKGKQYFTFVTPETRRIIEEYLATREPLKPEDPLFATLTGEAFSGIINNISRQWRILVQRANLLEKIKGHRWVTLHAHVLRKFFQTRTKLAGCRSDFVDFWMGHTFVKPENYLNDSYFRPNLAAHLDEYRKAIPNLVVFSSIVSKELRHAESAIEDLKKENAEIKETLANLQMEMFRRSHNLSLTASREEILEEMRREAEHLEDFRRRGLLVEIDKDGVITDSKTGKRLGKILPIKPE